MFSLTTIPPVSMLSMYTTTVTAMMLLRTVHNEVQSMINQLLPQHIRDKIISKFGALFGDGDLSRMILIINQQDSLYAINEVYEASEVYLSHKFTPSVQQLQVSKASKDKAFTFTINKGQKVIDTFDGMELQWEFLSTESQKSRIDFDTSEQSIEKMVHKSIQLSFHNKYKEKVLSTYLPYVVERSQAIAAEHRVVKLHALQSYGGEVNLDHPSTFETLAMDPSVKSELMEDLDRFVKRKDFYKRVGKAWKRGYLLYGPPGTGKSSLIAAMANYLKFDIYELDLTSLQRNSDLRNLLLSTTNKSILVIEDIDCGIELQNRTNDETDNSNNTKLTLSGLLNFIDGLWSSCGDERIIVFTTNYKERLDPALLRPGRMDKHIHMSYCTPPGFQILARNYLQINTHHLFPMIEQLILEVEVTPAQVAEELMKSEDIDVVLQGLLQFLQLKKCPETTNASGSSLGEKRSSESDLGEVQTKKQRSLSPEQEDEGYMLG